MIGSLASLALLGAMAAFGSGLLARLAPFLDPLERAVYGTVLGVVIGSHVLLILAIPFGLHPMTTVAVGILAAIGAVLLIDRDDWPRVPIRPLLARASTWVIGILILRFVVFWAGAVEVRDDGLWIAQANLWADWAQHLGDVTSFAYGDNFPPGQTRFAGAPLAYHYLTSITTAAMVTLGLHPWSALSLHSAVFCVAVVLALFAFARRFTCDRTVATLATVLFLVGGGLGWLVAANGPALESGGPLLDRLWDTGARQEHNLSWLNVFFASIAPQRAYLYGLPLFGLILTTLLHALRTGSVRGYLLAGIFAGLLPFSHLGTMLALAIVTPILFFQFPGLRWSWFFAAWVAIGLPQILLQQGGSAGALSAFRWAPGWVAAPDPWLWFWLKNLGCFLPLLVLALGFQALLERIERRMLWAFMTLFLVSNLFVFQPWDWDNTKLLVYWYLAGCLFVASLLTWSWRRFGSRSVRVALTLVVASLLLSGILQNLHQMLGLDRNRLLTLDEMDLAERVREETPPDAVFLTGHQHNHPIHVLAGRSVVMGYTGWLWSQGYDYGRREADVRSIYALSPETDRLLRSYGVDYVVVGPAERDQLGADPEAFRSRYPSVIQTGSYEVFRTSPIIDSTSGASDG